MRFSNILIAIFFIQTALAQTVQITPMPVSVKTAKGTFTLDRGTVIATRDEEDRKAAAYLNKYLQDHYGFALDVDRQEGKNYIRLTTRKFVQAPTNDAYRMTIGKDGVSIEGDTYAGTFYGVQSLIQLFPTYDLTELRSTDGVKVTSLLLPFVDIEDYPRFSYRGMHLDIARHFQPVSYIKKYIDYLALHKMNYFHWHLTDDQGWRIEIKKYPELMSVGAWRNGTIIGRYPGTGNDNTRYGGYYTQDDVREVVQYATDRHITVIPEIEMPGHASAAIATYPWLSCFPEQKTKLTGPISLASQQATGKVVQETWGVFDDVFCAGKDSTFQFLEGVLEEVLPLFPSKYIHVGGDESPKTHWKKCPRCQQRIKDEGLKDEHHLQSYFIQRMEKWLNARGRTLIGWDEILEGGLAPNAVVMSWRGEAGGIAAAKQAHNVIMTPQKPVYFDHTQSTNEDSVTIGGYNPVEAVYAYEPVPAELSGDAGKYILGAQANLWTEYIKYPSKIEYMVFPRMSALSEVLWTPKNKKNWSDFESRLPTLFQRYQLWGAHYSGAFYDMKLTLEPAPKYAGVRVRLETKDKKGKLAYTSGSGTEKNYVAPFIVRESGEVTAVYAGSNNVKDSFSTRLRFNKATGKKVTLKTAASKNYPGDGAFTLVNGVHNDRGLTRGREFLGWNGGDMEATIDLGKAQRIDSVILHTLHQEGSWIYRPSQLQVYTSADGKKYKLAGQTTEYIPEQNTNGSMKVKTSGIARYVRVVVKNYGVIPDGKPGAGNKGWLFVDEIEVH